MEEDSHVLVLGTCRDDSGEATEPLSALLRQLGEDEDGRLQHLHVLPLTGPPILQMLRETLDPTDGDLEGLAREILLRTRGNALHIHQILAQLGEEALLVFHPGTRRWTFDLRHIEAVRLPEDLTDIIARHLKQLAPEPLSLLRFAACLGSRFTVRKLALVSHLNESELLSVLPPLLRDDLLEQVQLRTDPEESDSVEGRVAPLPSRSDSAGRLAADP